MTYFQEKRQIKAAIVKEHTVLWTKLKSLQKEGRVLEFWQTYRLYLEKVNIISGDRLAIYEMVKATILILEQTI